MLIWKYHYVLNMGLNRKNNTKQVWNPTDSFSYSYHLLNLGLSLLAT